MDNLHEIFGSSAQTITVWQVLLRTLVVFVYALIALRLAGRRVLGKWSGMDIAVSVIVGSNLSRTLTGNSELVQTLAGTTLLLILHWIVARLTASSSRIGNVVEGRAVTLSEAGRVDVDAMHKHAVSESDLLEALRGHGVETVEQTRQILIEPSGKLSVLK